MELRGLICMADCIVLVMRFSCYSGSCWTNDSISRVFSWDTHDSSCLLCNNIQDEYVVHKALTAI